MSDLAVVHCRQLVTLAGAPAPRTGAAMRELGILEDGAFHVRDGRIVATGTRASIEQALPAGTEVVDAGGRIVLPGFVDAHTHPVFAGTRAAEFEQRIGGSTYSEIAATGGGIRSTVRLTREATIDALLASARRYQQWFLRGGTTTIEAKSGYGLSLESEAKILRVIRALQGEGRLRYIPTFLGAHEIPDEYRGDIDKYVDLVIEKMLPHIAAEGLAEACDIFCEPNVFPVEQARRVLQSAKTLGMTLRVHADQFTGDYGSLLAAELRAATADHLEASTPVALDAMREAGVQPVLLPASVYHLGSTRYPNARAMIERGLAVVLASDFNPGSSPTASMPMVLSLASTQMRMTPAEAITAATINAAHSLRRAHEIGSLEPGKSADFAIHDCEDYRELPYFFGRETARTVYLTGRAVYSCDPDRNEWPAVLDGGPFSDQIGIRS